MIKKSMKRTAIAHRNRQLVYTASMREQGFRRLNIWVHDDDAEAVQRYVARKFQARR